LFLPYYHIYFLKIPFQKEMKYYLS
jgi:hypothetical protein